MQEIEITVQVPDILDPRPLVRPKSWPLAQRLPVLSGRHLLLVDNGYLRHWEGPHAVVYPTLIQRLQAQYGVAGCQRLTRSWAGQGAARQLASEIRSRDIEGVVIALCAAGNAAVTLLLAWELERQGLPTVTICDEAALPVAAAMTASVFPGLPLSPLAAQRPFSDPEMMAEMVWVAGEIEDGMTRSPDALVAQFHQDFVATPEPLMAAAPGQLTVWESQRHEVESGTLALDPSAYAVEFYEAFTQSGFGDGLPMIPPTRERVEAMLRWSDRPPTDRVVPRCFPSGLPLTVGTLAIHAVMAGCRPNAFPLLLTAGDAVATAPYRLTQTELMSPSSGHAILMSGPLAEEAGFASEGGCVGPGFRANLTTSRALNLALSNTAYPITQRVSLAALGSPIQLAFCSAENRQASPWSAFHVDQFDTATTCVTVMRCESLQPIAAQLSPDPDDLLQQMNDVVHILGRGRTHGVANLLVLLNPAHARCLQSGGWDKAGIQRYVSTHFSNPSHGLRGQEGSTARSDGEVKLASERILIFVMGTDGPQSMVGLAWGDSQAVTQAVTCVDGSPARRLTDFYSER